MDRSAQMILAWIGAMESAQPQYGPLLQSTVDTVGYPAIDSRGVIRTIRDGVDYWGAVGYIGGFAGTRVENMMYEALGSEYPKCKESNDEEGMVRALDKGKFYETFSHWIRSTEPQKLPMKETPDWLVPFIDAKAPTVTDPKPDPRPAPPTPSAVPTSVPDAGPGTPSVASLLKGANVRLSTVDATLTRVTIGLGWDARSTGETPFDLDASAFAVGGDGKVRTDAHFVFYNNLRSPDGAIVHQGDNITGGSYGDDEQIEIHLPAVEGSVTRIIFLVSIYDAVARGQTFGQVRNAFIRVANTLTGQEIARYDLSADAATETAMTFGEIYRRDGEWKFRAIGQGYASGLAGAADDFGVDIDEPGTM